VTGTSELIDALVDCATPVRRLRPPFVRAMLWLGFAGLVLALVAIGHGLRADLTLRLHQPTFAISTAAALATGILAAVAAFAISLPDRSRWWLMLPIPTLAVWISTIGYDCITDWVSIGPEGVRFGDELRCFALLVLTSVPLAVALVMMLRYAAMLRAGAVAMTGGLAIAAITATALSLFHDHDATAMVLVWNLGTAALITGIASTFGRRIFGLLAMRLRISGPASDRI
jgi:hypothetical protein